MPAFLTIIISLLAIAAGILAVIFIMVPAFKGIAWLLKHIFEFIFGMIYEVLRMIGGVLTSIVLLPLILANVVIGRWSAASHYGRTLQDEIKTVGRCGYRFAVGRPARLLLLTPLVEGIEKRVPEAMAHAPGADKPSKRTLGQFDGYKIVGSLRAGGSGGRLYIADLEESKRAAFQRRGMGDINQVVIKVFSLADGSSLPQIVRESKSLDAARRLGLILEHELTDKRFYYVMRYVPGETLSVITARLHDRAGPEGLRSETLSEALTYASDLVRSLNTYHDGGLWHKDVKPDNIIVSDGEAHLVDFGLVTPLRSAMTLTTHGTEYFRDPEMVRMALKGVKVAEVNGAKFDIYAAGAVIYSIIENGFPAHGGLSQITKKCPEGLRWIIRRAMADYDARYPSTRDMLSDIEHVLSARDPFAVRPADLPSMHAGATHDVEDAARAAHEEAQAVGAAAAARAAQSPEARPAAYAPPPAGAPRSPRTPPNAGAPGRRPRIRITDWWKGGFVFDADVGVGARHAAQPAANHPNPGNAPPQNRRPAREQVERARARVEARRSRAYARMNRAPGRAKKAPFASAFAVAIGPSGRVRRTARYDARPNAGVMIAAIFLLAAVAAVVMLALRPGSRTMVPRVVIGGADRTVVTRFDMVELRDALQGVGEHIREAGRHTDGETVAEMQQAIREWTRGYAEQALAAAESARTVAQNRRAHVVIDAPAPPSPPSPPTPAEPKAPLALTPAPGGVWLLINDLTSAPPDVQAEVAAAIHRLRSAGAVIIGPDADEDDIDQIASARKAIGPTARVNDDAVERVKSWLASEDGAAFTGLIWYAREDGPDTKFALAVVGQEGLDAAPVGAILRSAPRASSGATR